MGSTNTYITHTHMGRILGITYPTLTSRPCMSQTLITYHYVTYPGRAIPFIRQLRRASHNHSRGNMREHATIIARHTTSPCSPYHKHLCPLGTPCISPVFSSSVSYTWYQVPGTLDHTDVTDNTPRSLLHEKPCLF